eukprot:TRINITY_DN15234_c0_g1_i2.p1 TRINITY_DN15234_c0_g1~~TRINITY_DN15234_c0_g1_i2.p1  ORF type:complete len:265 (+),score=55.57 TRINITY_DN15234_c0_g1_i2:420-1214(+)
MGWLLVDNSTTVVSFDWLSDPGDGDGMFAARKQHAESVLRTRFGGRWRLVDGDSRQTVAAEVRRGLQCDLFHVDGAHIRGGVLADLRHFSAAVRGPDHLVLLDDMQFREIQKGMEDFRGAGGMSLDVCHVTRQRDPFFTHPGKKLSKKKVWCRGRFAASWKAPVGWEAHFESVSGVTRDGYALRPAAGAPLTASAPRHTPTPATKRPTRAAAAPAPPDVACTGERCGSFGGLPAAGEVYSALVERYKRLVRGRSSPARSVQGQE